jgi:hypothetical protein
MRSQRAYLSLDSPVISRAIDAGEPDEVEAVDEGRSRSTADYDETYLDWPPRRRKAGHDRSDRHAGAVRRLRRLSR